MTKEEWKEQRLREIAHRIWEDEGRPSGEDRRHWEMAKEILANEKIEGEDSDATEDSLVKAGKS